jgi:Flp pilus assembly protein CpaB
VLAAAAVGVGLTALAPAPAPTVGVVAAARDLPGGHRVTAGDLTSVQLPPGAVPDGAVMQQRDVVDRVLVAAVRRHQPLTDVGTLGPALLAAQDGDVVATPVRLPDAEVAGLLRPGDRVNVLAAPAQPAWAGAVVPVTPTDEGTDEGTYEAAPTPAPAAAATLAPVAATGATPVAGIATVVASDVLVLASAVDTGDDAFRTPAEGGLVVLATTPAQAAAVVAAAAAAPVAVVLLPR